MRTIFNHATVPKGYGMAAPSPIMPKPQPRKAVAPPVVSRFRWNGWLTGTVSAGILLAVILYSLLTPARTFRDPLAISLSLAGNFGELRSNHFHMGLDVRTNGKEDLPVYAVADGYVSRIIIEPYALGRAIFITHPNGYTSVYAHLNTFYDALETAVEKQQRADRQREQDITFPSGRFPVSKGDFIANSGNTGGSEAPHLHFELRDTRSGNNLNPLLHGYAIDDDEAPLLKGLYWYNRQYSTYRTAANAITIEGNKGHYKTTRKVIMVRSPLISLGIRGEDKCSDNRFTLGIYAVKLWLDGKLIHEAKMDNFSYEDSRYINGTVDYSRYIRMGSYVQHLSVLPGNRLKAVKGDGLINVADGKTHTVKLELQDVYNNTSTLESAVQYSGRAEAPAPLPSGVQKVVPGKKQVVTGRSAVVYFSAKAFYDTVPFLLTEQAGFGAQKASPLVSLHNAAVPVHDEYTVRLKAYTAASARYRDRTVMQLNTGRQKYAVKGKWEGDWMSAGFNTLGTVQLLLDTIPPVVQLTGWKDGQVFSRSSINLPVRCKDETAAITSFAAEVDGKWTVYDQKGDDFIVLLPQKALKKGKHALKVTIKDVAGNTTQRIVSFVKAG